MGFIVLFQVEASGTNSSGQSLQPLLGLQDEGSRDEVSKPGSPASRIIISLFQIVPVSSFAMAGEDPPFLGTAAGRELSRGSKNGRGGSSGRASGHGLQVPGVVPDRSAETDLQLLHEVSLLRDKFDCGVLFCSPSRRSRPCSRTALMRKTRHFFRLVFCWILSTAASHSFPPAGRAPGL